MPWSAKAVRAAAIQIDGRFEPRGVLTILIEECRVQGVHPC
jgi:hypothetical protein